MLLDSFGGHIGWDDSKRWQLVLASFFHLWHYIYRTWQWVTRRVSYKKQDLLSLHEHLGSLPVFLAMTSMLLIFLPFCVLLVLFCTSSFCVLCPMLPVSLNCRNPTHGEVYSIQQYMIKFVSDLQHIVGFLRFHPQIKLSSTI